jgi:nucleoside-diphosphate-sugar epimerase
MNQYNSKLVVITGGAGFIGINLVQALKQAGACISIVDLPTADFSHLPDGVTIIKQDILQAERFRDVLLNADFVFHLAARTDLNGKSIEDYRVNYEGTRQILSVLQDNHKLSRFVLYSTQLVVGLFNETRFIDETEPYRTKTIYGESKVLAEKLTRDLCKEYKLPYTILRPTSVYGPYGKEPYREYFLSIKRGYYFHIGKAANLISMVYVKNLIEQTLLLANNPSAIGQIYFGNDFHPYTMRQFSDATAQYFRRKLMTIPDPIAFISAYAMGFLKLFGILVPLYPFRLHNIKANYCYDISNSIRLGFFPPYTLEQGIRETLAWYTANDKDFQNSIVQKPM